MDGGSILDTLCPNTIKTIVGKCHFKTQIILKYTIHDFGILIIMFILEKCDGGPRNETRECCTKPKVSLSQYLKLVVMQLMHFLTTNFEESNYSHWLLFSLASGKCGEIFW